MSDQPELVINLVTQSTVAEDLKTASLDGFRIERVTATAQSPKFGLADAVTIVAVVKGLAEAGKLAMELWKLLRHRATDTGKSTGELSATLSTPDGRKSIYISATMKSEDVKEAIRQLLAS